MPHSQETAAMPDRHYFTLVMTDGAGREFVYDDEFYTNEDLHDAAISIEYVLQDAAADGCRQVQLLDFPGGPANNGPETAAALAQLPAEIDAAAKHLVRMLWFLEAEAFDGFAAGVRRIHALLDDAMRGCRRGAGG